MALLHGCRRRLPAKNGGFRPGQWGRARAPKLRCVAAHLLALALSHQVCAKYIRRVLTSLTKQVEPPDLGLVSESVRRSMAEAKDEWGLVRQPVGNFALSPAAQRGVDAETLKNTTSKL